MLALVEEIVSINLCQIFGTDISKCTYIGMRLLSLQMHLANLCIPHSLDCHVFVNHLMSAVAILQAASIQANVKRLPVRPSCKIWKSRRQQLEWVHLLAEILQIVQSIYCRFLRGKCNDWSYWIRKWKQENMNGKYRIQQEMTVHYGVGKAWCIESKQACQKIKGTKQYVDITINKRDCWFFIIFHWSRKTWPAFLDF